MRSTRPIPWSKVLATAAGAALAGSLFAASGTSAGADQRDDSLEKALTAAAGKAPATLQTPFERSGGAQWTTHPESLAFYRQLDQSSKRVSVSDIGRTTQGRPLQLVSIGAPAPKNRAKAATGSVAMFVCSVHGNEPSGREACMKLARDLATSKSSTVTRLLSRTTVLFVNANPDGWVANTRGNADRVDVNRDYLGLATPEARAITKVIRDWNPDVLNDLHEYGPSEYYRTDLLHLWPRNRNVDDTIHSLSVEMSEEYSAAQARDEGFTAGIYGHYVKDGEPFLQVAGDEQVRILRNYAGLVNVVGMLSETATRPLNDDEAADVRVLNNRRVDTNYASALGSAQMIAENRRTLARETAAAAERAIDLGASQGGIVYFGGQDDMVPTLPEQVEPEPMCGYRITPEVFAQVRQALDLHDLKATRAADSYVVSLAQANRALVPLMFDERSEWRVADGTPLESC
ncbi:succinylglutamate desuccinylase/aspartoacylase family protein [Mumia sp. ZJ1417]|uniref:M14 family zinc carboxypeptidase n=1 Tax=Mumia sp. ZJ1417 TaxID=2708082 RepID=UPI0014208296|nr:M14 family zinc carboxypeptidase [Mumia sp. ZJ1417]QMW65955.1 succinylglutamate desuccinylase/aspartoacylase family protein [Mumia sp. ZJ1417]